MKYRMLREVNVLSHLPQYLQKYREMQEIANAENPEFEIAEDERQIVLDNQFIKSCNEDGIARFEKLMNINVSSSDDLDLRISRVLSRWNDTIPYTYRILKNKLNALLGESNYTLELDANNYKISISISTAALKKIGELQYLFDYILPANLELYYEIYSKLEPRVGIFVAERVISYTYEMEPYKSTEIIDSDLKLRCSICF